MLHLSPEAALVLIDMQKAVDHPSWGRRNNPHAEEHVARLLAHWRGTGRPLAHVRHISREPRSTFRPGQIGIEFKDASMPLDGETVITKHRPNALIGTRLAEWLRERGISQLVIAGVATHNSVEATARVAADLGFEAIVVSDAAFTFDGHDFDGRHRSAEEVHAMSLANLAADYATICTTDEVIDAAGAQHLPA